MFLILLSTAATCVDPGSYGAIADDGKSDTAAIQRAMAKNPDERFQSVRELSEALSPGMVFDSTAA